MLNDLLLKIKILQKKSTSSKFPSNPPSRNTTCEMNWAKNPIQSKITSQVVKNQVQF